MDRKKSSMFTFLLFLYYYTNIFIFFGLAEQKKSENIVLSLVFWCCSFQRALFLAVTFLHPSWGKHIYYIHYLSIHFCSTMTSHRKQSPVEVIDICDDDDDDIDNDILKRDASKSTAAASNTSGSVDSDRKPAAGARATTASSRRFRFSSLSPVRKRALSSSLHQAASTAKKSKVKTEAGSSSRTVKRIMDEVEIVDVDAASHGMEVEDDDEVEVVNAAASCIVICPPVAAAAAAAGASIDDHDDDDLQVVGTTGTVRLPHLREDCTEKTFQSSQGNNSHHAVRVNAFNRQCCDMCYCKKRKHHKLYSLSLPQQKNFCSRPSLFFSQRILLFYF
jgi:hypothetical protein